MSGLREQFQRFYAPDAEAIDVALRTGVVTPDTNVLLSLYRLQPRARDELFRVLEQLGDRLWIPHQVALEFHQNRLKVIAEQESFFGKARKDLDDNIAEYIKRFRTFSNRIALPEPEVRKLIRRITSAHEAVGDQILHAEQGNQAHLDSRDSDELLSRLEVLFKDRIGGPMADNALKEARKEAKARIEAKVPPGYMDRGKSDPAGDYIIWRQFIQEATKRHIPTIFITDDRKEDWFRREHGLTLGPRIELCEEMENEASVPFLLMTTETFLIQAKEHLSATVSPTTVEQAKELPEAREKEKLRAQLRSVEERIIQVRSADAHADARIHELKKHLVMIQADMKRLIQISTTPISDESTNVKLAELTGQGERFKSELDFLMHEKGRLTAERAHFESVYEQLRAASR